VEMDKNTGKSENIYFLFIWITNKWLLLDESFGLIEKLKK